MKQEFPGAVPEMPVSDIDKAAAYYVSALGFVHEWGDDAGGIAGVSRGQCRIFLTNPAFRQMYGNAGPVLIWLNLDSREAVNEFHAHWSGRAARILSPPESKPWKLQS